MIADDAATKIIIENKKYRILRFDTVKGVVFRFDMSLRLPQIQLDVEGTLIKLQQRCWFFGWYWKTLGTTNIYSIGKEWVETYFEGK